MSTLGTNCSIACSLSSTMDETHLHHTTESELSDLKDHCPSHGGATAVYPSTAVRKGRRSISRMTHLLGALHAFLLVGTVVVIMSFSRYMERSLPRELRGTDTTTLRSRQRTYPRVVACLLQDENRTTTPSLQCQAFLHTVLALDTTFYEHPEDVIYPLKPSRTVSTIDSEPDRTRFYPDPNISSRDLPFMEPRIYPKHEYDPHCEPIDPSWQSSFYPVCNEMHSQGMADALREDSLSILSIKGSWRLAWRKKDMFGAGDAIAVWKTFK